MKIAVIGITHNDASVDIRGRVAFTTTMKEKAYHKLVQQGLDEFMILSTCNRSEIYVASMATKEAIGIIKKLYREMAGNDIESYLFVKEDEEALSHLYQVACGLDSLVLGEDQILGQLKDAMHFGIEEGSCKKHLSKVVREAITFSKKVRHTYKFSENQLSVAAIGIKCLKKMYGPLHDKKVMVIGTGAMGELVLKYLEAEKIKNIYVTNRTYKKENAKVLLDKQMHVIEYDERYDYIRSMDIIISATGSPHMVLSAEAIEHCDNKKTYLDMAVPRDIDPNIDKIGNSQVITIDDFHDIANQHKEQRLDIADKIKEEINLEVTCLNLWLLRSKVDDVIAHLQKKQALAIKNALKESEDIMEDAKQITQLETIIKRAMWSMMKEPIEQLKGLSEESEILKFKDVMIKLYKLES